MAGAFDSTFEHKVFWLALSTAALLHAGVIAVMILTAYNRPATDFQLLAVMEFAHYDPEGGTPEGGEGDDDPAAELEASTIEPELSPVVEEPETVPMPEPEPISKPDVEPEIIESISEQAPSVPVAPIKPKEKPKPKTKTKTKTKPKSKSIPAVDDGNQAGKMAGGITGTSDKKQGGGIGDGRGGIGGGRGQGNPNIEKTYIAKIRSKINRNKKYPPAAKTQKLTGVVTVHFTINRQGAVVSSRIVKGSGHSLLDQEVMALMKRVSPFPAMPKEMPQNSLSLTIPIQFSLR